MYVLSCSEVKLNRSHLNSLLVGKIFKCYLRLIGVIRCGVQIKFDVNTAAALAAVLLSTCVHFYIMMMFDS